MKIHSLDFKGYSCFRDSWSVFPKLKSICIIIGKNNTGKSHYLNFISELCKNPPATISNLEIKANAILTEQALKREFREGTSGGHLEGDHWAYHGRIFLDAEATWDSSKSDNALGFISDTDPEEGRFGGGGYTHERLRKIEGLFPRANHGLYGKKFRQLFADRDIQPEIASGELDLRPNGTGATNIIRRFLTSENNEAYPRDLIRHDMLEALNDIFDGDGNFTEIAIQQKDEKKEDGHLWEIYLAEKDKGLIALSNSGSSLKTVFLVLLNVLVLPKISESGIEDFVFSFEELENNLHPSLLRRLLSYLETHAEVDPPYTFNRHPLFFLTTHSNVTLDYFVGKEYSQIVHITHNGQSANASLVSQNSDQLKIIRDLGSKPSDLLQANGVIWVEGPSDRIYLNRWISLWSD